MNVLTTPMKAHGESLLARQSSVRQGHAACHCLTLPGIHLLDPLPLLWVLHLFLLVSYFFFLEPWTSSTISLFLLSLSSWLWFVLSPLQCRNTFFFLWVVLFCFVFFPSKAEPRSCHWVSHSWALGQTAEPENWNEGCKASLLPSVLH